MASRPGRKKTETASTGDRPSRSTPVGGGPEPQPPAPRRRGRPRQVRPPIDDDEVPPFEELGAPTISPDQALVPAGRDLERADPLTRYFMEIARYPLLSPEEVQVLARRVRDDGDLGAARRLATGNLRLVVSIALQFRQTWNNLLDLIQEGNVGLMKAIEKFDPDRNLRFSTYATWWIRAYILKYILDNWSLVRVSTSNDRRKAFFNLRRERERLRAQGVEPEPRLLAERLGISEDDVREVGQALDASDLSLDAPIGEDRDATPASFLPAPGPLPGQVAEEAESRRILKEQFARFAAALPERERAIFQDRLAAEDPATLQDLAQRFDMTREGVRQVEKRVVASFREFVMRELGGYVLDLAVAKEEQE